MTFRSWTDKELRCVILESKNFTDVMRKLNLCDGINRNNIKKYVIENNIDISHFESNDDLKKRMLIWLSKGRITPTPLDEILVKGSTYNNRASLKKRLYKEGLKKNICEICGQGEIWNGRRMSLILDHINGDRTDNNIENIRIVCPNCNATLPTHAGKNKRNRTIRICACGKEISGDRVTCSPECFQHQRHESRCLKRKVERPPYDVLLAECKTLGFCAVGRKYGVTDKSIRKWIKHYEVHIKRFET